MQELKTTIMEQFTGILTEAIPGITPEDFITPINESGLHSLDAIVIRHMLESHFDMVIPDELWYSFATLSDIVQFLSSSMYFAQHRYNLEKAAVLYREHEIRLPQMANMALSENWLLKEIGDIHWELISRGLGQKTSAFADVEGNRLYAAFVRIQYSLSPLNHFKENEVLAMKGAIKRSGNSTYYSSVKGRCNGKHLDANLMTSFSARYTDDNARFCKSRQINTEINCIEQVEGTPRFYEEHRLLKKGMTNEIKSGGESFSLTNEVIATTTHSINPHYEINGVGLLYFAAYPIIADECTTAYMKNSMAIKDHDAAYFTTHRDIFYIANCNANETIKVDLNTIEYVAGNKIKITTTLYRESDGKLMARVLTIKEKIDK